MKDRLLIAGLVPFGVMALGLLVILALPLLSDDWERDFSGAPLTFLTLLGVGAFLSGKRRP